MSLSSFRAVLIGADSLLLECGDLLIDKRHEIVAVVSDAPRVRAWAQKVGLRTLSLGDYLPALASDSFDYLFAITHLAILPDALLSMPRTAAINFHDGPLPRYAGLNAPAWALINGEQNYGITWHEIRGGIDEGDILKQRTFAIAPGETSVSLNTRNFAAAIESFGELVDELASGAATRTAQDLSQRSYFGKLDRPVNGCVLDFDEPARKLAATIRGLDFGDYDNALGLPKLVHRGQLLLVRAADAVETESAITSRTITALSDDALEIATGSGSLRITQLSKTCGTRLPLMAAVELLGLELGGRIDALPQPSAAELTARSKDLARAETFWLERLRTLEPATLALAQPERATGAAVVSLPVSVPTELRTPAALLTAVALYVARTTDKAQIDFGYRDLRREHSPALAPFVAARVPLRFRLDETESFSAATTRMQSELDILAGKAPFLRDLVARYAALRSRPEVAHGQLAQFAILQRAASEARDLPTGAVCALALDESLAHVTLLCDPGALDDNARALLSHQLDSLLVAAASEPQRAIAELPLVSESEAAKLRTWNQTQLDAPSDATTISAQFEAQVTRTPEQIAAVFEAASVTYRELDVRAGRLATILREQGVGAGSLVGVYVERGLPLLIATLGVLKAGGAYLPLDPSYPQERLSFMLSDSGTKLVVTQPSLGALVPSGITAIDVLEVSQRESIAHTPQPTVAANQLAYIIYTSGSTGEPKGVLVEHQSVVNFFRGMDQVIAHEPGNVWLSVTSLSFDISVLELFWTLSRGLTVVIYHDRTRQLSPDTAEVITGVVPRLPRQRKRSKPIDFSLFMWGAQDTQSANTYTLMLEAARFGDTHGFAAIWTPERHFHAFGGAYPNPAVTGAALAAITKRMQIRAGSCVVTLHHPARVAEEWSVVDNISGGRVGISFASGWQPDDFLLQPNHYKDNKRIMLELIDQVRRLWRGEELGFPGPLGKEVRIRTQPRPVQAELPFWVTAAGHPDTFRAAGRSGANILTHLLGQSIDEVQEKIAIYRSARAEAGFDPKTGVVTLMMHTYLGESVAEVREIVREPMKAYLRSSVSLIKGFAWAFPAFKRPAGATANPDDIDIGGLAETELDAVLEFAFERYFETSGLFGTPDSCRAMIERLESIGVDDVACLIDFGVPSEQVLASLRHLDRLRALSQSQPTAANATESEQFSLAAQIRRHHVTHLQCTPSMLRMSRSDDDTRAAIDAIPHLMIGGEAFPSNLAQELSDHIGTVTNMYGPTETTVWSATHRLHCETFVPLGRPIANTRLYVLDAQQRLLPIGVPGELYIAGTGVVRGYHQRPELTRERFRPDPFAQSDARMYRTGDLVRWSSAGEIEFLGRTDHQVKVRGYRIELGEIEAVLLRQRGMREAVVVAREDVPGDVRLIAYVTGTADESALREAARASLPSYMVPAAFVQLDQLPQTPNGKIDRKALPPPGAAASIKTAYVAPENDLEASIAKLWCEVLGTQRVGTDDNFFDIGGHSLLVVKLHRRLKTELPFDVALTDLYRFPTVRSLVKQLIGGGADVAVEQAQDRAALRLERQATRRDLASRRRSR